MEQPIPMFSFYVHHHILNLVTARFAYREIYINVPLFVFLQMSSHKSIHKTHVLQPSRSMQRPKVQGQIVSLHLGLFEYMLLFLFFFSLSLENELILLRYAPCLQLRVRVEEQHLLHHVSLVLHCLHRAIRACSPGSPDIIVVHKRVAASFDRWLDGISIFAKDLLEFFLAL